MVFKVLRAAFGRTTKKKEIQKIRLGICAMDKKAQSKPMREILKRFPMEFFEIVYFGDECILHKPIEEWPVVEVLIAFYSSHYPTAKAIEYIKLVKPYLINDLEMDAVLKDRRRVYDLLQANGIDVPIHVYCNRDDPEHEPVVEEFDEYIIVNGVQINKPLVEKPVDAEDHNVYIYYPSSAGGGSKRLYRKVDDKSSTFYPHENELRREGSYIYEEFVVTQGTDVKVYTVGLDYGHAEARKSPVVDGRVIRDTAGLEVRYPVILSHAEKEIARKIVTAFKQTVCGFDILRVQGRSYCCDVNGFSFVKKSSKYYDDASQILVEIMVSNVRPEFNLMLSTRAPILRHVVSEFDNPAAARAARHKALLDKVEGARGTPQADDGGRSSPGLSVDNDYLAENTEVQEELRCVIAVVRHGDRTPKQKMKVKVTEKKYLDYFHSYVKDPKKDVKVKSKAALLKFLAVTREIVADTSPGRNKELIRQLKQIKDVLERWEISGINRKLQMKPQKWDETVVETAEDGTTTEKPGSGQCTELLLILKWGGDLTPLGRKQAEELGKRFRTAMYPGVEGGGMLRLHATYRHDLKIKASDEGRVMKTAAAFAKGLLELEGSHLTPILASLVTVEENNRQMLDREGNREIKEEMDRCKDQLNLLQSDQEITEEFVDKIAPNCSPAVKRAMLSLGNPKETLQRMHSLIGHLCDQLNVLCKKEEDDEAEAHAEQEAMEQAHLAALAHSASISSISTSTFELGPLGLGLNDSTNSVDGLESTSTFAAVSGPGMTSLTNPEDYSPGVVLDPYTPLIRTRSPSIEAAMTSTASVGSASAAASTSTRQLTPAQSEADVFDADHNLLADINKLSSKKKLASDTSLRYMTPIPGTPIGFKVHSPQKLYLGETLQLMTDRWEKLYKDFYSAKQGMYDLSKVPDVYDSIRYEVLHNSHLPLTGMEELFDLATKFENSVVPQEYGATPDDKRRIGSMMCNSLLFKIKHDLQVSSSDNQVDIRYMLDSSHAPHLEINSIDRAVRTRLYFTSESHLYTLLNVLRYSADGDPKAFCEGGLQKLEEVSELSYLTQVIFRLFEDRADPTRFRCEVSFSPGAIYDPLSRESSDIAPYILLNKSIPCDDLMACLDYAMAAGDERSSAPTPSLPGDGEVVSPELLLAVNAAAAAGEVAGGATATSEEAKESSKSPANSSKSIHRTGSVRKVMPSDTTVIKDSIWP